MQPGGRRSVLRVICVDLIYKAQQEEKLYEKRELQERFNNLSEEEKRAEIHDVSSFHHPELNRELPF